MSLYIYNLSVFLYLYLSIGADSVDMDKVQIHPTGFLDPMDLPSELNFIYVVAF